MPLARYPAARAVALLLLTRAAHAQAAGTPGPAERAWPAGPGAPPVAAVRPVRETYFGRTVVDPYRWLEDLSAPEVRAWIAAQGAYARRVLDALPDRAALLARITALSGAGEVVGTVRRAGGLLFYLKQGPGDALPKLYVRAAAGGAERLLVDPARRDTPDAPGRHVSVDYLVPSFDGRLVAYGSSAGGSEDTELRVVETATGRELPDRIAGVPFGLVAWRPDGRALFVTRFPGLLPGAPPLERYRHARAALHVLGTDPARDVPLLGPGATPGVAVRVPIAPDEFPMLVTTPGSSYVLAAVVASVRNEVRLYAAPLAAIMGRAAGAEPAAPWRPVADTADAVTAFGVHGDEVYLLTHRGAPRFKVVRTSLARPDLATAATVLPEGAGVIRALGVARDALYVQEYQGGFGALRRVPFAAPSGTARRAASAGSGTRASAAVGARVPLPFRGTLDLQATTPTAPGAVVSLQGWTQSPRVYAYDPAAHRLADTDVQRPHPADVSAYEAEEVEARAADGTPVPLSVVHRRGLARDGSHPTLLEGYGAYGVSADPYFNPRTLAWLERGGVYAVAHVRGGGELGAAWHLAGKGPTKPNSWGDFLACAQALVDRGYTSPARLAATGVSAGGLLVGRAITERPDLFGAVLIRVGESNALRNEAEPSGAANVPEFGTLKDSAGFAALYAMDAYQHVRDGVAYPAVLLTTGLNDPRVAPWQAAKMAARLQAATSNGRPVLLRVEADAGHGYGSTRAQRNAEWADLDAFLLATLRPAP